MLEHPSHHVQQDLSSRGFTLLRWFEGYIAFGIMSFVSLIYLIIVMLPFFILYVGPVIATFLLSGSEEITEFSGVLIGAILAPFALYAYLWVLFGFICPLFYSVLLRVGFFPIMLHRLSFQEAHNLLRYHRIKALAHFDGLVARLRKYVR